MSYRSYPEASLIGIAVGIAVVVTVGLTASRSIMGRKPAQFLRTHAAE